MRFMCNEHDFSEERIGKFADKLFEARGASRQKGIDSWVK